MKIAATIMAVTAALSIGTSALAEQPRSGTVTKIDRISGTIAIQETPGGTVGANTGGATEEFRMQDGARLNALHAGDRVTFTATDAAGTRMITKIDKR
jgi:Cu/Ag efflux protein CusF